MFTSCSSCSHNGTKSGLKRRIQWAAVAESTGEHGMERGSWHWKLERHDFRQKHVIHIFMQPRPTGVSKPNRAWRLSAKLPAWQGRFVQTQHYTEYVCGARHWRMCACLCVYVSAEGVALRLPKGDLAAATTWIPPCFQWTIVRLLLRGLDIMAEAFKGKQKCCFTKRTQISQE